MPVTSTTWLSTKSLVTVIWFFVKVPVLSVQMTVQAPSVSALGNFRTNALREAMRWTPSANAIVTTAGSPSGMAATASASAAIKKVSNGFPCNAPRVKTHAATTMTMRVSQKLNSANFFWSGVSSVFAVLISLAILPISVKLPVVATMAFALPATMMVLAKSMHVFSEMSAPALEGRVFFWTGVLSPVRFASWVCKLVAVSMRQSAGTLSPDSRSTMSPGTSSEASRSISRPSRMTFAFNAVNFWSNAIAFSARYSCANPRMALSTTIIAMT